MGCLYHGDYGPADPRFVLGEHGWTVDAHLLASGRNLGEAEAIQRHVLRGEPVSWCHQGYSWVDQDAIGWFYFGAFAFVVLPYLGWRVTNWSRGPRGPLTSLARGITGSALTRWSRFLF